MATLKISDLSVGDWVKVKKCAYFPLDKPNNFISNYAKVTEIEDENCTIWLKTNVGEFCASLKNIEPIPITAEILEKNGFENSGNYWTAYHDYGDYVEIFNDGDKWYLSVNSVEYILCPLHWVHQIQHLLRVWGIDKEINL